MKIVGYGKSIVFTAKNKHLYKFDINDDGVLTNMKTAEVSGESTCSPAILDGKAYLGTNAKKIDVVDLTTMKTELSITTPGYPQSTPTVSKSSSGSISILATYNMDPGGIYFISIKDGKVVDSGDMFIPGTGYNNYCLSKIVTDENGVMYYKNDSGYLMAVKGVRGEQASSSSSGTSGSSAKAALSTASSGERASIIAPTGKNLRIVKKASTADNDTGDKNGSITKNNAPKSGVEEWLGDNMWPLLAALAALVAIVICAAIYRERRKTSNM